MKLVITMSRRFGTGASIIATELPNVSTYRYMTRLILRNS